MRAMLLFIHKLQYFAMKLLWWLMAPSVGRSPPAFQPIQAPHWPDFPLLPSQQEVDNQIRQCPTWNDLILNLTTTFEYLSENIRKIK